MATDAVFAYGSLMHPTELGRDRFRARLVGYQPGWTVATDNTVLEREIGYFDPLTGARPPCQVLFLNADPTAGASIDGILVPVRAEDLSALGRPTDPYGS